MEPVVLMTGYESVHTEDRMILRPNMIGAGNVDLRGTPMLVEVGGVRVTILEGSKANIFTYWLRLAADDAAALLLAGVRCRPVPAPGVYLPWSS